MTETERDLEVALAFESMPTEPGGSWSTGKPGSSPLGHWKWVINREYITREVKSHLGMPVGELIDSGSWRPVPATEAWIVEKVTDWLFDRWPYFNYGRMSNGQWEFEGSGTTVHPGFYYVGTRPMKRPDAILAAFLKAKGKS